MSPPVLFCASLAEKQVHEEVAKRRRGLQCAGGGGGLPGRAICGVCSSAASCDAGSLNRSPCSHKVTETVREMFGSYLGILRFNIGIYISPEFHL